MNELKANTGNGTLTSGPTLSEKCNYPTPQTFGFAYALEAMRSGQTVSRLHHYGLMRILKNTSVQHVEQDGTVHAFLIPELLVINKMARPGGGYELVTLDNSDLMAQDYIIHPGQ